MLKEQIEIVQRGGEPLNVIRDPAENVPGRPPWKAGRRRPSRLRPGRAAVAAGTTNYRFNFHKVSQGGWKYIEDDVDRYCPDRELILKLYEEAERLMQR